MAVPNPPSLSAVCAEFGAPANTPLSAFVRGGAWVPNVSANASVPTTLPISLSQLAGAVKYVPVSATPSPSTLSSAGATKGTTVIGTVTINASGGTGSYTFGGAALVGGSNAGSWTGVNYTQSGNQYTFRATLSQAGAETVHGTYQVNVSDGTTNTNVNFSVNWN